MREVDAPLASINMIFAIVGLPEVVRSGLRGIFLRSPGGTQSVFAYESFIDELAEMTDIDPLL
jgi:hypothetical protein